MQAVYSSRHHEKAGWNVRIQSQVNGETILVSYFHLQENNRVLATSSPLTTVKAGDIIGYQGDSGNLKKAIADGTVESHLHIEVRVHNGSSSWGYSNYDLADPSDFFATQVDQNGQSTNTDNCN